jgi:hypothetical protein
MGLDVHNKYRFDLKYVDYFGKFGALTAAGIAANGTQALLKDRGAVYLTFKTSF